MSEIEGNLLGGSKIEAPDVDGSSVLNAGYEANCTGGIPNSFYGHGVVNALRAVQIAQTMN